MKVSELIDRLKEFDQDLLVVVDAGPDGSLTPQVSIEEVALGVNIWHERNPEKGYAPFAPAEDRDFARAYKEGTVIQGAVRIQ